MSEETQNKFTVWSQGQPKETVLAKSRKLAAESYVRALWFRGFRASVKVLLSVQEVDSEVYEPYEVHIEQKLTFTAVSIFDFTDIEQPKELENESTI